MIRAMEDLSPHVMDLALKVVKAFEVMKATRDFDQYYKAKDLFELELEYFESSMYVNWLGAGCSRYAYRVFTRDFKKSYVIKLEIGDVGGCNTNERAVWERIQGTEFEQHFAPILGDFIHSRILMQEYVPPTVYPGDNEKYIKQADELEIALRKIGVIVHDDRPDKNGAWHDKVIVFDYGNYRLK